MAAERRRDEFERDTTLAWQVNRVYVQTMNKKKLPSLESLLPKAKTKVMNFKPSLEEQRANLMEISRRYKIPIKEVPAA